MVGIMTRQVLRRLRIWRVVYFSEKLSVCGIVTDWIILYFCKK